MLIRKIVRKTLGIKDHRVVSVKGNEQRIVIELDTIKSHRLSCSCCGRRMPVRDRLKQREWRHVPLWNIPVIIRYRPARVRCIDCGIKVESIPWSNGKSSLAVPLSLTLASWAKRLPIKVVADIFGVCWNTVYSAVNQVVAYGLSCRSKAGITTIGIDEISRKKGHTCLTQIYDLSRKRLLGSVEDRTYASLCGFFRKWGEDNLLNIKGVCCDMWDPYIKAFTEYCPHASIVFDPFHVVAAFSRVIDKIRAEQYRNAGPKLKNMMKRSRFLLLKNPENLNDKEQPRLEQILKENKLLSSVYLLKAYLKRIWQYKRPAWARKFLDYWCTLAYQTDCRHLIRFAKMLRRHSYGLVNHCNFPIHTGKLEGINNKIKLIKRKAYGFINIEYFTLKIMQATCN